MAEATYHLCFLLALWLAADDGLPPLSDLERMPPSEVVELMRDHNAKFDAEIDFWWRATPFNRDILARAREENSRLAEAWDFLATAHRDLADGAAHHAREMLADFRDRCPEFYYGPAAMPACPYWLLARN